MLSPTPKKMVIVYFILEEASSMRAYEISDTVKLARA